MKIVGVISYFPIESAYIRGCKKYVDIIEIRADLIGEKYPQAIEKFSKIKPVMLTIRSEKEGGYPFPLRKEAYLKYIPEVDFIDVEISSIPELEEVIYNARSQKKKVVLSCHFFDRVPSAREIDKLLQKAELSNGDVFKIAVFSNSYSVIVELALWLRKTVFRKTIDISAMCMGNPKVALLSRIVFPVFGSKLVYGRVGNKGSAPGQPDAFLLHKILKEDRYF